MLINRTRKLLLEMPVLDDIQDGPRATDAARGDAGAVVNAAPVKSRQLKTERQVS
jgi:hypothetical protein